MSWALATIAVLLIGYATASRRLEGLNVSGAMFFTTAGLLAGAVELVDVDVHGEQVKLLAEITLTLVLFADASRISLRALRGEFTVPLRLLGIELPLTIVVGALLAAAVLPGLSLAEAFVLAIVLACTDAALGQAVVADERVPSRIRQGLNLESGLNDGCACRCSSSRSPLPRPMRAPRRQGPRPSWCSSRSATGSSGVSSPACSAGSRCGSPPAGGRSSRTGCRS